MTKPKTELPWEKAYPLPDCGPARLVPEDEARELWEVKNNCDNDEPWAQHYFKQLVECKDENTRLKQENKNLRESHQAQEALKK
jgi:hypothetical protein